MRKPVLVIRLSTEKPEAEFAKVVGVEKGSILTAMKNALNMKNKLPKTSSHGERKNRKENG